MASSRGTATTAGSRATRRRSAGSICRRRRRKVVALLRMAYFFPNHCKERNIKPIENDDNIGPRGGKYTRGNMLRIWANVTKRKCKKYNETGFVYKCKHALECFDPLKKKKVDPAAEKKKLVGYTLNCNKAIEKL